LNKEDDNITYEWEFDPGTIKENKTVSKKTEQFDENELVKLIKEKLEKKESLSKIKADFMEQKIDANLIDRSFIRVVQVIKFK